MPCPCGKSDISRGVAHVRQSDGTRATKTPSSNEKAWSSKLNQNLRKGPVNLWYCLCRVWPLVPSKTKEGKREESRNKAVARVRYEPPDAFASPSGFTHVYVWRRCHCLLLPLITKLRWHDMVPSPILETDDSPLHSSPIQHEGRKLVLSPLSSDKLVHNNTLKHYDSWSIGEVCGMFVVLETYVHPWSRHPKANNISPHIS